MADKEPAHRAVNLPDQRPVASKARDIIERGDYSSSPVSSTTFFILRALDPIIQYSILRHGVGTSLLHRLGIRTLPPGAPAHTGMSLLDGLHLSPYRLILLGMSVGSAAKQNLWLTALSREPMSVKNAVLVGAFNTILNSLNNYAFLCNATSASTESSFPQPALIVGTTLYVTGILTELISEIQRYRFKADPKNQGKPYTGGLWALARHINYGAHTIWKAGFALAGGGWLFGAALGAMHFYDFATRGVPVLNEYCERRYGADWEAFKRQTKYRLIPFIY